ncbi:MAG: ParB family transcriptional regulator, chromosome partitioning protein [Solirubrobacteraceae bacterium]|nr:ParB family transcriptional regulator, chromosome partitioning protein [Solirubrobacteraceae bacterium]
MADPHSSPPAARGTGRSRGMGRGLAAILTASAPAEGQDAPPDDLRRLPVDLIVPNPHQPRRSFDEDGLQALAGSLAERGVLQPVLVRPVPGGTYELIAGERRWRAARLAGFDTVPALVRPHDDAASLELALIENMAREDLNCVEEARACALLVEELGLARDEIGRRVGRSRVAVSNLMRLLDLPDEALDLLAAGLLTEGHGRAILLAGDHDERRRLARRAAGEEWSVRRTEEEARAAADSGDVVRARRGPGARAAHPDHLAAAAELEDTLGRALGAPVRVAPKGAGYRVTLTVESHEDAVALAERMAASNPA